jgi:xylose dehydrogenase (NAD/NADP)
VACMLFVCVYPLCRGGVEVNAIFVVAQRADRLLMEAFMYRHHEVLAQFDAGFVFDDRHDLEIVGEQASLFVTDPWHCRRPGIELRSGQSPELIEVPAADAYRLEADNLAAAIRGQGPPLLGRADAAGQARTIEALYAAAGSGRSVELKRA